MNLIHTIRYGQGIIDDELKFVGNLQSFGRYILTLT